MAKYHEPTWPDHADHLLEDAKRIDGMVDGVPRVDDIEGVATEPCDEVLAGAHLSADSRGHCCFGEQAIVLSGQGIDGSHGQGSAPEP